MKKIAILLLLLFQSVSVYAQTTPDAAAVFDPAKTGKQLDNMTATLNSGKATREQTAAFCKR